MLLITDNNNIVLLKLDTWAGALCLFWIFNMVVPIHLWFSFLQFQSLAVNCGWKYINSTYWKKSACKWASTDQTAIVQGSNVYCYNCCISLLVIFVNLLQCLVYKLNFIRSIYVQEKVRIGFGTISDFRNPLVVLECICLR